MINYYRTPLEHDVQYALARGCDIACKADDDRTQQQFRDEADIAKVFRRFKAETIPLPAQVWDPSNYGDTGTFPDLRAALEISLEAQARFLELPANIRKRFDNSPAKLWEFVQDDSNRAEAQFLGLLSPPSTPPAEPAVPAPEGGASPSVVASSS